MPKIIGIDLGTTNSCVAVVDVTTPQVIPNREGSRTTPSVVGFTEDNERLVGQIAKRQAITNPFNTVFAIKRLIGRKYDSDEVGRAKQVLPYQIVAASNGDMKVRIRDREYSPEEISAFVLMEIRAFAEDFLGEPITEAIITVPAYFNDSQRQATRDAGKIAGLEVLRIINEPTAAALAYGLDNKQNQLIAVYDLGGGTFDISILKLEDGLFEVLSTSGDTYLGGEDFDKRIMDWMIDAFQRETNIDLREDRMALQRLKEAAERAKHELSMSEESRITLPFISADASGPKHLNNVLTRHELEKMVEDLIQKTIDPVNDALKAAGVTAKQIDEVVLVGGQTRMPRVIEAVKQVLAVSSRSSSSATPPSPRRTRSSSPPYPTTRTRCRSTCSRGSVSSRARTSPSASSTWWGFRRRRAASRRSRSPSLLTPMASSTSRPAIRPPASRRACRSIQPAVSRRTRSIASSTKRPSTPVTTSHAGKCACCRTSSKAWSTRM